jgi:nicotinamidase-related amidase
MTAWEPFLTARDREVEAQYGSVNMGWGKRPVIAVVDVNYNFTGPDDEPILESMKKRRNSTGHDGWVATANIATLLETARAKRIPIIYTTEVDQRRDGWDSQRARNKNARRKEDRAKDAENAAKAAATAGAAAGAGIVARTGKEIHHLVTPQETDILVGKKKPSAFFATPLTSYLIELQADSIIVTGLTTSGCVRATVVDGFSLAYRMYVVEECTADRFESSHAVNLHDMQLKWADVVKLQQTIEYLESLPDGLFDEQFPALRPAPQLAAVGS